MNNIILAKCVTNIDDVDVSHIKGFSCKPEIGERVSVTLNGKPIDLEVVLIRHTHQTTINGYVPILEVELGPKRILI